MPALRHVIENKENDRRVRAMAINALSTNQASEEAKQILIDAINDGDPMIVQGAIRGMVSGRFASRDSATYIAHLIDAMGHSNSHVRRAAYSALGSLESSSKPAVSALVRTLQENKDNEELIMIIHTLGRIGAAAEEAVPALIELWKSNSRHLPEQTRIRQAILKALPKIAPEEVAKLPSE